MPEAAHLWAIGYDNTQHAEQVRQEVIRLGGLSLLTVLDTAVVVRELDGSSTVNRVPQHQASDSPQNARSLARLFACMAMSAPPLTEPAVDYLLSAGCCAEAATSASIPAEFVRNVQEMIRPGTSALFLLDEVGNLDAVLENISGLGGTVLKTNVDLDRVKLVQSTLTSSSGDCDGNS
jgi:uncharacterized membrane protein